MKREELLDKFISYFKNGYQFEEFCKIFLNWLNFNDVKVTKRSGDGGVDLTCTREEIEELELNTINYVVQVKKYAVKNKVSAKDIRDLKGTTSDTSTRRIFITTSFYTPEAIKEASDKNNPVTLIDGNKIMDFLMKLGDKIFDVKYYFSESKLDDLFISKQEIDFESDNIIERRITKNDVRARILCFPIEYKDLFKEVDSFTLVINNDIPKKYKISSDKRYFGGISKYYKDFLTNIDFQEGKSYWKYDKEKDIIYVNIK